MDLINRESGNLSNRLKSIFMNEVRVGSIQGIEKVGPRIYAWKIKDNIGMYIMDNVAKMVQDCNDCVAINLGQYLEEIRSVIPIEERDVFYKMLANTLYNFYKITKGWHGDLHFGNIMVVLDKGSKKLKAFKIIDYGSHQLFSTNKNLPNSLKNMFNRISNNFNASTNNKVTSNNDNKINGKRGKGQSYTKNQILLTRNVNPIFMQRLIEANQEKIKKIKDLISSTQKLKDLYTLMYKHIKNPKNDPIPEKNEKLRNRVDYLNKSLNDKTINTTLIQQYKNARNDVKHLEYYKPFKRYDYLGFKSSWQA